VTPYINIAGVVIPLSDGLILDITRRYGRWKMNIVKSILKAIYGVIIILWLLSISFGLSSNLESAQSAVQASQLYNEATTTILGIIAGTLLLIFFEDKSTDDKSAEQTLQQAADLAFNSKHIADVLDRIEQRLDNSNAVIPKAGYEVEKTNSAVSSKLEQPLTSITDIRLCPKCDAPMIIRTSTKGENLGKLYYVCSNYPKCREILPVESQPPK
jgi:hypothetical protein